MFRKFPVDQCARALFLFCLQLAFTLALPSTQCRAQVVDPVVAAQEPVPGVGHHYIGMGAETVNPADGSLTFNLPIQTPAGRGLSFPFGIYFNSSEPFTMQGDSESFGWAALAKTGMPQLFSNGGWSYKLPNFVGQAIQTSSFPNPNSCGNPNQPCPGNSTIYCYGDQNLNFRGFDGNHSLGVTDTWSSNSLYTSGCNFSPPRLSSQGDNGALASITLPANSAGEIALTVTDRSGTAYQFPATGSQPGTATAVPFGVLAQSITDRNGNQITLSDFPGTLSAGSVMASGSYMDTLGRTVVKWDGLGQTGGDNLTVSGLSNITVKWTTTTVSFPVNSLEVSSSAGVDGAPASCSMVQSGNGESTIPTVSEIDLPNKQKYLFSYDATTGQVSQITFPDGEYVVYKWGANHLAQSVQSHWTETFLSSVVAVQCNAEFDTPAITERTVYDVGGKEMLDQTFTYTTDWDTPAAGAIPLWTAKTTTVASKDEISGLATQTQYLYSYVEPANANVLVSALGSQVPVEQTVTYQTGTGTTLKTVNKTWQDQYAMTGEQTVLDNGQGTTVFNCIDQVDRTYLSYEFDFQGSGGGTALPKCSTTIAVPSPSGSLDSTKIGALLRYTQTAYGAFGSANILDEPSNVTTYDASGNQLKQTIYSYDGASLASSNASTGLVAAPGGNTRGNATKIQRWLNLSSTLPTTTYIYFDTGQVQSMTDACGNTACLDMNGANHTTSYSYTDNYSSSSGQTNTNAYLTQVTYPATAVAHTESFTWGYNDGLLMSHTDQNSQTWKYAYSDSLLRLTSVTGPPDPNNGNVSPLTTYAYTDYTPSAPSASTFVKKELQNTSNIYITSTSTLDGIGRVVKTITNDSPSNDRVDTVYNGFGQVSSVSNPYRATSDPTYGLTASQYDVLGRKLSQTDSDGTSTQYWAYSGNTVNYTDESGNQWLRTSDALGRLTQVLEPNGASKSPSMETDYSYNLLDDLTSVTQWGGSSGSAGSRSRSFTYDSLSRLLSAFNPETGTVCYGTWSGSSCINGYDANGNLMAKTDARLKSTAYTYDVLNRIIGKSYNDPTPISCYQYDVPAVTGTSTNPVGRLTAEWTQSASCPTTNVSQIPAGATTGEAFLQYDPMGRVLWETYCTSQSCNYSTKAQATYDLAGDTTSLTYPDGRVVSQTFDQVARPTAVNYYSWNGTPVSTNYLTVTAYDPIGHATATSLGTSPTAITTAATYNKRLETTSLAYLNGTTNVWKKNLAWTSNGNLQTAADVVTGNTRQYGYDTLNRLLLAQDIAGTVSSSGETTDNSDETQTNVLQDSQALGTTGWGANMATLTPNSVMAPDGTMTAGSLIASSGATDAYATDGVLNPALYDNATMIGTAWMRVPSGTLNTYLTINDVGNQGYGFPGNTPVTLTTSWQQFAVTGTNQNGLTSLALHLGGFGTVTNGQEVDIWGPQLAPAVNAGSVTNIISYSQQIGGPGWGGYCAGNTSNVTLNTSAITAPDGTYTSTGYVMPSSFSCGAAGTYGALTSIAGSLTAGQTYTTSIWLKGASGGEGIAFGLNDCSFTNVTLTTSWQRFVYTASQISSGVVGCAGGPRGFQFQGTTPTSTFYAWGAQTENSSSAGQYVATLDTPVTVTADSTNILPSADQVGGQGWGVFSGTYSSNVSNFAAPDGTFTADQVSSTGSNAYLLLYANNPALYDGAKVTASIYLAVPSGSSSIRINLNNVAGTVGSTIATQTVTVTSAWQRFDITGTNGNGLSALFLNISGITSANPVYLWGAQMVLGASPDAPIATTNTTTSVTNGNSAYLAASGMNQGYSYDAFGNMISSGNFNFQQAYTTANQLVGWNYDQSGNILIDANGNGYGWDAEGRATGIGQYVGNGNGSYTFNPYYTYVYDAEGDRVSKTGSPQTDYINFGGRPMARLSGGQWTDLIYGVSGLLAEVPGTQTGAPVYRMLDHLGTQVGTLSSTGVELSSTDYAPFGQLFAGGTADPYQFTGKERDAESGLDYFGARYYASTMGRWVSPDPGKINIKHLANPQKWNKYAYVLNNPLSLVDPDGMEEMWVQYRAFIPPASVGVGPASGRGDNRTFSSQENASSRISVTMHIETDPAKNGGNPLLGVTTGVNTTHNNLTGQDTAAVVVQAPTVTATQDANGNVNLNVQMNVHSGDLPAATAIRSDVNIGVNQAGTQASVSGTTSVSPAFETNIAPQGGPTTNIPVQNAPQGTIPFFNGLAHDHQVNTGTVPIKQPQQ